MTDWFLAIEGTEIGRQFAFFLALMAGVLHSAFGAMQKGSVDPWIMRGAIDISYGLMALPVVFYIVPWPETNQFVILSEPTQDLFGEDYPSISGENYNTTDAISISDFPTLISFTSASPPISAIFAPLIIKLISSSDLIILFDIIKGAISINSGSPNASFKFLHLSTVK